MRKYKPTPFTRAVMRKRMSQASPKRRYYTTFEYRGPTLQLSLLCNCFNPGAILQACRQTIARMRSILLCYLFTPLQLGHNILFRSNRKNLRVSNIRKNSTQTASPTPKNCLFVYRSPAWVLHCLLQS